MKVEVYVLTADGATYTKGSDSTTGVIPPNTRLVLEDTVSINISAPSGEAPGQSVAPTI